MTLPLVLFPYAESGDRTIAAVLSWIFIFSALLFTLVMERLVKTRYQSVDCYYL